MDKLRLNWRFYALQYWKKDVQRLVRLATVAGVVLAFALASTMHHL
jgi:hypothetical protein